jgi:hypothetical protein
MNSKKLKVSEQDREICPKNARKGNMEPKL